MFVGNVDVAQRDRIAGWAADTDFPNGIIEVVILVAGREVGRARADGLRQDLRDLGPYGDGRHGFDFTFDEPLPADEDHDVAVRFAASDQPLGHGKFRLPHQARSAASGSQVNSRSRRPRTRQPIDGQAPALRDPYRDAKDRHEISAAIVLPAQGSHAGRRDLLSVGILAQA